METKVTRVTANSTSSIISGAENAGYYQPKGSSKLICPDCGYKQVMIFRGQKNNDKIKYDKIYACSCGWRRLFPKKAKTVKIICKTKGCNAVLPKDRKAYCYRCRPYNAKNTNNNDNKESERETNIVM